jgi:hypothetical protein
VVIVRHGILNCEGRKEGKRTFAVSKVEEKPA